MLNFQILNSYKLKKCSKKDCKAKTDDIRTCIFYHNKQDKRRYPLKIEPEKLIKYSDILKHHINSNTLVSDFFTDLLKSEKENLVLKYANKFIKSKNGFCKLGCQNFFEFCYHPFFFKSQQCHTFNCSTQFCFFFHNENEQRDFLNLKSILNFKEIFHSITIFFKEHSASINMLESKKESFSYFFDNFIFSSKMLSFCQNQDSQNFLEISKNPFFEKSEMNSLEKKDLENYLKNYNNKFFKKINNNHDFSLQIKKENSSSYTNLGIDVKTENNNDQNNAIYGDLSILKKKAEKKHKKTKKANQKITTIKVEEDNSKNDKKRENNKKKKKIQSVQEKKKKSIRIKKEENLVLKIEKKQPRKKSIKKNKNVIIKISKEKSKKSIQVKKEQNIDNKISKERSKKSIRVKKEQNIDLNISIEKKAKRSKIKQDPNKHVKISKAKKKFSLEEKKKKNEQRKNLNLSKNNNTNQIRDDKKSVKELKNPISVKKESIEGVQFFKIKKKIKKTKFQNKCCYSFSYNNKKRIFLIGKILLKKKLKNTIEPYLKLKSEKVFYLNQKIEKSESDFFSEKFVKADEIKKYLCGFLNKGGGSLFLGISENGEVKGVTFSRKYMDDFIIELDCDLRNFKPPVFENQFYIQMFQIYQDIFFQNLSPRFVIKICVYPKVDFNIYFTHLKQCYYFDKGNLKHLSNFESCRLIREKLLNIQNIIIN